MTKSNDSIEKSFDKMTKKELIELSEKLREIQKNINLAYKEEKKQESAKTK